MTINIKIFSRTEAISLFRLMTSVRSLTFSAIASTFRVIIEDKLERNWKKVVVACFKVFRRNLPGLTWNINTNLTQNNWSAALSIVISDGPIISLGISVEFETENKPNLILISARY
jgi:hypothetical protein